MRALAVFQNEENGSLVSSLHDLFSDIGPEEVVLCFAYATTSGFAEFNRIMGSNFWQTTRTKWLISIDWGRTQPSAIELLQQQANAQVRIVDGARVIDRDNFVPSVPYHPKGCFLFDRQGSAIAALIGSGNFSRGGLVTNIELAIALLCGRDTTPIEDAATRALRLWEEATPAADLIEAYKLKWKPNTIAATEDQEPHSVDQLDLTRDHFWIEAGYVTRNRGLSRPGNQIDMPRGVHRFFGLAALPDQAPNTTIGAIRFLFEDGYIERNLRYGNNHMEKITLPIPETHDYGSYDGKILEFHREQGGFKLQVHEPEDFRYLRGGVGEIAQMDSGRHLGVW